LKLWPVLACESEICVGYFSVYSCKVTGWDCLHHIAMTVILERMFQLHFPGCHELGHSFWSVSAALVVLFSVSTRSPELTLVCCQRLKRRYFVELFVRNMILQANPTFFSQSILGEETTAAVADRNPRFSSRIRENGHDDIW
jgi:hypothetical protein